MIFSPLDNNTETMLRWFKILNHLEIPIEDISEMDNVVPVNIFVEDEISTTQSKPKYKEVTVKVEEDGKLKSQNSLIEKGFEQKPKPKMDKHSDRWRENFHDLLEFRKMHSHCLVPRNYNRTNGLGGWVKRQRYKYKLHKQGKKSSMTNERIKILESIGFVWDSYEEIWQTRIKQLTGYKKEFGHCAVPSSYTYNPQLAIWVKCQRRQYRRFTEGNRSSMTVKRIETLNKLKFEWKVKLNNAKDRKKDAVVEMTAPETNQVTASQVVFPNPLQETKDQKKSNIIEFHVEPVKSSCF